MVSSKLIASIFFIGWNIFIVIVSFKAYVYFKKVNVVTRARNSGIKPNTPLQDLRYEIREYNACIESDYKKIMEVRNERKKY